MPITSAPTGRNRHMSISHRRDNPFIMAGTARHTLDTLFQNIYCSKTTCVCNVKAR